MDSTLAAGIVGGACAIIGSAVSHILLHYFDRKKDIEARRRVSLEFALVFLEKCKTGAVLNLSEDDYYELIRNLASLERPLRSSVIEVYQYAKTHSLSIEERIAAASRIQADVAKLLM